ncbi:MAG: hypothetical protein JNK10_11480 [Cyclobacteriaceae bacterium]|nr:hypothetical protein [Cyclobacteriaceae bacterium]
MAFQSENEILAIVKGFQDRTLPKEKWTHDAHLVTAIWYHVNHTAEESICYLRSGIISYNEATGGKNTPTDGYHETMTLFWCKTIDAFVAANRSMRLLDLCNKFLQSELAKRDYPFRTYSKELLLSGKARAMWVGPDKA